MEEPLTIEMIADQTDGFNGADVVEFCEQLKNGPILRSINNGTSDEKIDLSDFQKVSKKVKSSVSQEDIEMLAEKQAS